METIHKIIEGDSRSMAELKNDSIHLVVTSPPYWQLKDYGSARQIGFDDSYESYINNLNLVWKECYRTLHPGCRLCVNIGDQFARSVYYGRYKVIPIRTEIIKFCETIGFDYMGAIIWQKVTTTNTTGGASIMGSFPYPRNGIVKIDYEFILLFKKSGKPPKVSNERKNDARMTTEEWNKYFYGHWNFSGVKQEGHLAMFPEELPRRLMKMFSFPGETVLDPFLGSGTTTKAAKELNRNSVGYEINQEFIPLIKRKVGFNEQSLFSNSIFEVNKQPPLQIDFESAIQELPYVFKDPLAFNNKTDPGKLGFGSRINKNDNHKNDFFRVKDIISPEKVYLNNDLVIRLIGVKSKPDSYNDAMKFLENKLKGAQVYIKYDNYYKYDENNNLTVYLYLKNRTFINAHLIKHKLVDVDENIDFSKRNSFLTYQNQ